ncbi:MAG: hypothetical protein PVH18_02775 [Chloroflexota bacterium]
MVRPGRRPRLAQILVDYDETPLARGRAEDRNPVQFLIATRLETVTP